MQSLNLKKVRFTLAAVIVAVIVLVMGYLFTNYINNKVEIDNISVTNQTSNSATIVWTTDKPASVRVEISTDIDFTEVKEFYDDRDIEEVSVGQYQLKSKNNRNVHHVTLRGLEPDKEYFYNIVNSNQKGILTENFFVTTQISENIVAPDPVYGKVNDQSGNVLGEGVVILQKVAGTDTSQYVSTVLTDGSYSLDGANMLSLSLEALYAQSDYEQKIKIIGNSDGVMVKEIKTSKDADQPVEDVVLDDTISVEVQNEFQGQVEVYPEACPNGGTRMVRKVCGPDSTAASGPGCTWGPGSAVTQQCPDENIPPNNGGNQGGNTQTGDCNAGNGVIIPNNSYSCFTSTQYIKCVNGTYSTTEKGTCSSCTGTSTNLSAICQGASGGTQDPALVCGNADMRKVCTDQFGSGCIKKEGEACEIKNNVSNCVYGYNCSNSKCVKDGVICKADDQSGNNTIYDPNTASITICKDGKIFTDKYYKGTDLDFLRTQDKWDRMANTLTNEGFYQLPNAFEAVDGTCSGNNCNPGDSCGDKTCSLCNCASATGGQIKPGEICPSPGSTESGTPNAATCGETVRGTDKFVENQCANDECNVGQTCGNYTCDRCKCGGSTIPAGTKCTAGVGTNKCNALPICEDQIVELTLNESGEYTCTSKNTKLKYECKTIGQNPVLVSSGALPEKIIDKITPDQESQTNDGTTAVSKGAYGSGIPIMIPGGGQTTEVKPAEVGVVLGTSNFTLVGNNITMFSCPDIKSKVNYNLTEYDGRKFDKSTLLSKSGDGSLYLITLTHNIIGWIPVSSVSTTNLDLQALLTSATCFTDTGAVESNKIPGVGEFVFLPTQFDLYSCPSTSSTILHSVTGYNGDPLDIKRLSAKSEDGSMYLYNADEDYIGWVLAKSINGKLLPTNTSTTCYKVGGGPISEDNSDTNIELATENSGNLQPGKYNVVGDNATTKEFTLVSEGTVKYFYDTNSNGVKDTGEADYTGDVAALNIQFNKVAEASSYNVSLGWNLITFPLLLRGENTSNINKASELINQYQSDGFNVTHVNTYRSGKFITYSARKDAQGNEFKYGEDFSILPGEAYFVKSYTPGLFVVRGRKIEGAQQVFFENGWNLSGIYNSNKLSYKALEILKLINTGGVDADTISKWENGSYNNVIWQGGKEYGNDYNIYPYQGYFIRVNNRGVGTFTPN